METVQILTDSSQQSISSSNLVDTDQSSVGEKPFIHWEIDSRPKLNGLIKPFTKYKNGDHSVKPTPPSLITIKSGYGGPRIDGVEEIAKRLTDAEIDFPSIQLSINKNSLDKLKRPNNAPPLLNPLINLPSGSNYQILTGSVYYAPAEKSLNGNAYNIQWYEKTISECDKTLYSSTYGITTNKIALVKQQIFDEEIKRQTNAKNRFGLYVCYASGRFYEKASQLSLDHVFPKKGPSSIHSRIMDLFKLINRDKDFRNKIFQSIGCFKKRWIFIKKNRYLRNL